MLGKMQENWITHPVLRKCKWFPATLESRSAVSFQSEHALALQPNKGTLGHSSQKKMKAVHVKAHTHVHSSCSPNSPKLETPERPSVGECHGWGK